MKIAILIPVYKRPEVWEVCARNLSRFIQSVKWEVSVACILSPEDKHLKDNEKVAKSYDFRPLYYRNQPVSNKMNAGINWLMSHWTFDYLMNFGSDDLIHPEIEALYEPFFAKKTLFFGINTLYFHHLPTGKTLYFDTYNTNGAIGAGRMIHYNLLHRLTSEYMPVYEPGLDAGLDTSSALMIKRVLNAYEVIIDSGEYPYIVDLKTDTNINLFEHLECRTKNIKYVDKSVITQHFEL